MCTGGVGIDGPLAIPLQASRAAAGLLAAEWESAGPLGSNASNLSGFAQPPPSPPPRHEARIYIYIYAGRLRDQLRRLVMSAVRSGQGHTNSATRRSCGDDHRPGRSRRDDDISSVGESGCAREGGSAQLRARRQLIAQTRRAQYVAPYSARPVPIASLA